MLRPRPLSPERQALADAIAAHAERQAEINAAATALSKAREAVRAAESARAKAQAAMETAMEAAAEFAMAEARGMPMERPLLPREARAALAAAEEDLAVAEASRAALEKAHRDAGTANLRAGRVKAAAAAVLRTAPEVRQLVDQVECLQRELVERGRALVYLMQEGVLDDAFRNTTAAAAEAQMGRAALQRLQQPPRMWGDWGADERLGTVASWQAAFEALQKDAAAPLKLGRE